MELFFWEQDFENISSFNFWFSHSITVQNNVGDSNYSTCWKRSGLCSCKTHSYIIIENHMFTLLIIEKKKKNQFLASTSVKLNTYVQKTFLESGLEKSQ